MDGPGRTTGTVHVLCASHGGPTTPTHEPGGAVCMVHALLYHVYHSAKQHRSTDGSDRAVGNMVATRYIYMFMMIAL